MLLLLPAHLNPPSSEPHKAMAERFRALFNAPRRAQTRLKTATRFHQQGTDDFPALALLYKIYPKTKQKLAKPQQNHPNAPNLITPAEQLVTALTPFQQIPGPCTADLFEPTRLVTVSRGFRPQRFARYGKWAASMRREMQ